MSRGPARSRLSSVIVLSLAILVQASTPASAREGHTVRETTYRALSAIHEAMEAGKHDAALERIAALAPRVRKVPFERAVLEQTRAYVLLEQQRHTEAAQAIQAALGPDLLAPNDTANLHYNLAQLHLMGDRPGDAVATLEALFANDRVEPSARGLALAGQAYYRAARYDEARTMLERAVAEPPEPPEEWLQLLVGTCYEQQAFERARTLLQSLVERFPERRRYWVELSALALYLEDGPLALASLELAEDAGLLDPADLLRLVRLNLHLEAPARAARLLAAALAEDRVEANGENLELLADAWVMAREYARANEALTRALAVSPTRRLPLQLRRGELLVHLERWKDAVPRLEEASASGDARTAARANLLLGIAAYYVGDYARSLVAFGRAGRHEGTRLQATQWSRQTLRRIE